jgi:hypothetical protein
MKRTIGLLILLSLLASILVACGSTPAPTEPAPTQTPRIVVVTTTPCVEQVAQVEASPEIVTVVVTATPTKGCDRVAGSNRRAHRNRTSTNSRGRSANAKQHAGYLRFQISASGATRSAEQPAGIVEKQRVAQMEPGGRAG